MADFVCIPISSAIYNECVLRKGDTSDVVGMIEHAILGFLDRTEGDRMVWSDEYAEKFSKEEEWTEILETGSPTKGYQWQNVFLPNGTRLKFDYKGDTKFAEVKHESIVYLGDKCSPSEFVSRVANHTSRNAWRDIHVLFPTETDWMYANRLRREGRK